LGNLHDIGGGVLVSTLTVLAVAQVGSLFSADAWNNVTFTAGEVKNPAAICRFRSRSELAL